MYDTSNHPYFISLHGRLPTAEHILFRKIDWPNDPWRPSVSQCHDNANGFVERHEGAAAVRGWLTWGSDENGVATFFKHSIVAHKGAVFDITPVEGPRPEHFLRHLGSEDEFFAMSARFNVVFVLPSCLRDTLA